LIDHPPPSLESPRTTREASRQGGEASFRFLEHAVDATLRAHDDPLRPVAIVTAPISKEAWALAGHRKFPGHTELLAARYGAGRVRMMFVAPTLRVMLVTTHVPLADVPRIITIDRVFDTIELAHESCVRLGIPRPRIAVCGVNPHAGEAGLLGDDEARAIAPAIARARARGVDASGPWPGDTIFNAALNGRYDIVVAMYHDQGLIPVKLLAFDRAVNYSAGLPVVRTSPDHGTAFDIAGKNLADPGSMRAAIELAVRLVRG
ncbi:MAG: 4-hydroxythreonine-4-phosphate dehydrogenase PdxA, partial [Phycisphaerae bacterium]|nr:4-hydroxythreonine-4-phosphate dehydrogenase PdxA [Phycisphaerae bacterium]